MRKTTRSRRILVSAPDELYAVLVEAAEATNQPVATFIRSWLEESVPVIQEITATLNAVKSKGKKEALLGLGAVMARNLGKGHEQLALLMQDVQNEPDKSLIISEEPKPKRRGRASKA